MSEVVLVVDDIAKNPVGVEEGHEANKPQLFKVVRLFGVEVYVHFHGLDGLRNARFDMGF